MMTPTFVRGIGSASSDVGGFFPLFRRKNYAIKALNLLFKYEGATHMGKDSEYSR